MAVSNPPGWLQNAGDTHQAYAMRSFISALSSAAKSANSLIPAGGVHSSLGFSLSVVQAAAPAMQVVVKSGVAWIPGSEGTTQGAYGFLNDADVTLNISAAHATLGRIDLIVAKVEDSQYSGVADTSSLAVVTGTPSGSPAAPAAPNNALALAQVLVGAAVTTIVTADITDVRTWLAGVAGYKEYGAPVVITGSTTFSKSAYPGGRAAIIECVGGGGGSGGAPTTAAGEGATSGGGAGGSWSTKFVLFSALAASETVTIGAGGTAGAAGSGNGGTGGTTSFGAHCVANGGVGSDRATATSTTTGTAGGAAVTTGCVGDYFMAGDDGSDGRHNSDGSRANDAMGGGSARGYGGQTSESNVTATAAAIAGKLYGGGASGAHNDPSESQVAGAIGGAGICIVRVLV